MVILQEVSRLCGQGGVLAHDVVVHEGGATEKREASRTAQHTAQHVLRGLLHPVPDGVLEHLVPHHGTCRHTMHALSLLAHDNLAL